MRRLVLNVLICLFSMPVSVVAQDATPPVLSAFSILPIAFDTGTDAVTFEWCADAQDNLSGISNVNVVGNLDGSDGGSQEISSGAAPLEPHPLTAQVCGAFTLPQYSPYGTYTLAVALYDAVGNYQYFGGPGFLGNGNLCPLGPCEISNRLSGTIQDEDLDGVLDDADNCPNDSNPGQEDMDLDLIGDVCDPFPSDRDNEQAACEADLAICEAVVGTCPGELALYKLGISPTPGPFGGESQAAMGSTPSGSS